MKSRIYTLCLLGSVLVIASCFGLLRANFFTYPSDFEEVILRETHFASQVDEAFALSQGGKILLQVEESGEAWYVHPKDGRRYFLGRPSDAFSVMRQTGLGITTDDLVKIYEPGVVFEQSPDLTFASRLAGLILLQVEENGEAWYVNPNDLRRYFLGRPQDAFHLMREFGEGISNEGLRKIGLGQSAN